MRPLTHRYGNPHESLWSVGEIVAAARQSLDVSVERFHSKTTDRATGEAKELCCFALHELRQMSYSNIRDVMGWAAHSSCARWVGRFKRRSPEDQAARLLKLVRVLADEGRARLEKERRACPYCSQKSG